MKWLLILLTIFLVGCTSSYVCPDGSIVDDSSLCTTNEEVEEAVEEVAEPIEEVEVQEDIKDKIIEELEEAIEEPIEVNLDPEIEEMLANAKKRVKSMKFLYVGPPVFMPQDTYSIRGDLVKVAVLKATDHKLSQPYTHVYMDGETQTATAYCEIREAERCESLQDDSWEMGWDAYAVKSPLEWMNSLITATYEGGGPTFENRKSHRVRFTTEDTSGIMNVVDYYAVPGLILFDDGTEIEFRDLEFNTVTEEDVVHNPFVFPGRD